MQSLVVRANGIVLGYLVERLVRFGETSLASLRPRCRNCGAEGLPPDLAAPETLKLPAFEILYFAAEVVCWWMYCRASNQRP